MKNENGREVLNTILRRRTTRKFSNEDVSEQTIEQVLEMAMFAPTRLGEQPWHFIVIRDEDIKRRLRSSLRVSDGCGEAPVLVAVYAERNGTHQWDLDAGAATQNLLLAATALGLGSAWIANPTSADWATTSDWFCKIIGGPDNVSLVALVALGYPAEELPAHTESEVYDEDVVHFERVSPQHGTDRGTGSWRDAFGDSNGWAEVDRSTQTSPRVG